ncbi:MAG: threonine synthase [Bacillota bacterium]|nr:threonine synthase [Bacillota bacterium]
MHYISTRGDTSRFTAAQAICLGQAPDGGLLVPESIPRLDAAEIERLRESGYSDRVALILEKFLTDFTSEELHEACRAAYDSGNFDGEPAPLRRINPYGPRSWILELWHGPTAAFKDMALQLLPQLMVRAAQKLGLGRELCILAATSGDTGKAALEGFRDVPGTSCIVFYPAEGVSPAQELQMRTTTGGNVAVVAVEGSFDDAQRGVKALFANQTLAAELAARGRMLSSANSINWGRLVAQIAYYWSSYADLLVRGEITPDESVNFVVPTGNFGNILAAWYAREMGLPVGRLVSASNRNKILSDFLGSGVYDRRREFHTTIAPSMDILVSSNLERLLFELTGRDAGRVAGWMRDLATEGVYEVGPAVLERLQRLFVGGHADDAAISRTIRDVYDETDLVIDTHTAVGFNVYERYLRRSQDPAPVVFVSTASPFKFAEDVMRALAASRPLTPPRRERLELSERADARGVSERREERRPGGERREGRRAAAGRRGQMMTRRVISGFRDADGEMIRDQQETEAEGRNKRGGRRRSGRPRTAEQGGAAPPRPKKGGDRAAARAEDADDAARSGASRRRGRGRRRSGSSKRGGGTEGRSGSQTMALAMSGEDRLELEIRGEEMHVVYDSLRDNVEEPTASDEAVRSESFFADQLGTTLPGAVYDVDESVDPDTIVIPETDLDRMLAEYAALAREKKPDLEPIEALAEESGMTVPFGLDRLEQRPRRPYIRIAPEAMEWVVRALLLEERSEEELAAETTADTAGNMGPEITST